MLTILGHCCPREKPSFHSGTIYFGPEAPEGKEKNWIPTIKGENWFAYFRFYGPEKAYIERTWELPDIEKSEK